MEKENFKGNLGGSRNDIDKFLSEVLSARTRSNGHNLKYRKLHLNKRKKAFFVVRLFKYWNRLLREARESPSLQVLKI